MRCVDGVESIRQIGTIRWGVNYYTFARPPGASYVDNVVNSANIHGRAAHRPASRIVPVAYGHAVDFNPLAPASANDHFAAGDPAAVGWQRRAIASDCNVGFDPDHAPYVWAPVSFAFGGTQVSG